MSKNTVIMIKNIAVLCLVALISAALLAVVNIVTYVDPLQETLNNFKKKGGATGEFTLLVGEDGESVQCDSAKIIYYAKSTDGVHAFLAESVSGYGGAFRLYVFISDGIITKLVAGENGDTYVKRVEKERNYYAEFVGKPVNTMHALDCDVWAVASLSTGAINHAVDAVCEYYMQNVVGED